MDLPHLKKQLQRSLGIVDHVLSDRQMGDIVSGIKNLPAHQLTEYHVQEIVTSVTGLESFMKTEAVDMSDIGYIIKQIEAELKKKNKK
jgi:hypothetical protein